MDYKQMVSDARFLSLLKHNKEIIYPTKEQEIRGVLSGLSKESAYLTLPDKPGSLYCFDLKTDGKPSHFHDDRNHEFKVGDEVAIVDHPVFGGMMSVDIYDPIKEKSTQANITVASYLDKYWQATQEKLAKFTADEVLYRPGRSR